MPDAKAMPEDANPERQRTVALRIHGQGQQGVKPRPEVVAEILAMIRERRP